MRISSATPKRILLRAAACLSLAVVSFAAITQGSATESKPYEWSATLVSFDDATNTAVFRAAVASHVRIDGIDSFEEGDRLILTWSGRSWASGIRSLAKDPALTTDALSLPVEFVSSEDNGRYVNFRIAVPESAVATISKIDPGMWVTGTSPRMATDWQDGVISLRHYNDVG